jgi:hypothetical protein
MHPILRSGFPRAPGLRGVMNLLALLVASSGCASSPDDPATGSSAGSSGAGGAGGSGGSGGSGNAGAGSLIGGITVRLIASNVETGSPAYTSLLGKFQDGPQPPPVPLELSRREGDCSLLVPSLPSCIPGCPSSALCTEDDVCTPFPNAVNVGTIDVEGLGAAPFSMEPKTSAFAYQPPSTLPNPPCEEGAEVRATTDSLTLESTCIAQLELTVEETPEVRAGEGVLLSWVPPGVPDISRVHIVLDVAHHGGKKGEIVCDVADTGSFEIPESLVTELVNLGLAGFPTIVVSRMAGVPGTAERNVDLTIASPLERLVNTGITSCTDDTDCPADTTCRDDLTCG